ncbi:hypothetical protein JG687_00017047 [Phytophthora cactorum]|uniref:Uncharacterized protein n=1 Tax=Phytophthora cactorum TaxID=29920 RepID=A0A8T1TQD5_9STRA|nr:hypothetical protein JG687_00017047 [Phytophthora cactorum]
MAVVNKKLSEAVAAGEGAKHNIEVEETEGQSDDDSDDTMTAGFWKTHIFKKRVSSKRGNMDRDLRVKAVARAPNQPGCDTADELSDYSPSPPPVLKRGGMGRLCGRDRQQHEQPPQAGPFRRAGPPSYTHAALFIHYALLMPGFIHGI